MCDNALSHLFHFYVNLARKSYQNSKMFNRGSGPRERERDRSGGHPYVGALRFVAKFRSCFTHTHIDRKLLATLNGNSRLRAKTLTNYGKH